ncbi:hypothetical protein OO012_10360 [Rhodobacteraceae bacterium KMM 6894]|nr:hypothetical protein [Rhodobacteraceae bacterium KMM 6894]
MVYVNPDPTAQAGVLALVLRERRRAANVEDWQNALRGYGYGVRQTGAGAVITTLPHGVEICRLPAGVSI